MAEADFILWCANCRLAYRPDERIYKDPFDRCPKCGADIHKADPLNRNQYAPAGVVP